MVGKDVAGEERGLEAPALRVRETRCGVGRQRDQLGPDAAARRCLDDPRAAAGVELVRNKQCGHEGIAAAAGIQQLFCAFYLLC